MVRKAPNPQSFDDAWMLALKILQRAAQTEARLREKLARRQYTQAIIDRVVERLKELNLVNDQKYAQDYVAFRSRTSPLGEYHLKAKLRQRGIAREIAEQSANLSPEEELARARQVAEKRWPRLARYELEDRKIKLARYLTGRGFSLGIIYRLLKELTL